MDGTLLHLLKSLLAADNEERKRAEAEYFNVYVRDRSEYTMLQLGKISAESPEPVIRGFSSVLLRRLATQFVEDGTNVNLRLMAMSQMGKTQLCEEMLSSLMQEQADDVVRKKSDTVAEIAKILTDSKQGYPQLEAFVYGSLQQRESIQMAGYRILSTVHGLLQQAEEYLKRGLESTFENVRVEAFRATCRYMVKNESSLMLQVLNVFPQIYQKKDDEKLHICYSSMIEVAFEKPRIFRETIQQMFEFTMNVIRDEDLEDKTRQSALEFILSLLDSDRSMMKKIPNITHLVPLCMEWMAKVEGTPWDEGEENDEQYVIGEQSLDRVARKLGGSMVTPIAFQLIPGYLSSKSWGYRHAGLLAISAIAEGCAIIMSKEVVRILDMVLNLVQDEHPRVRFALCNCLGQLCTDFGPKIQRQHHAKLVPCLMRCMQDQHPRVQAHGAAAMINFCDRIDKTIIADYLQSLLCLLEQHINSTFPNVQGQAIATIATITETAEDLFRPYSAQIFRYMVNILKTDSPLLSKAIECCSILAASMEDRSTSMELCQLFTAIQNQTKDEEVKQFLMHAWARMCQVFDNFKPYLELCIPPLIKILQTKPEFMLIPHDDPVLPLGWECTEFNGQKIAIRSSQLEDKETALELLCIYARTLKEGFEVYSGEIFLLIFPLFGTDFSSRTRQGAVDLMPYCVDEPKFQQCFDVLCESLLEHNIELSCDILNSFSLCFEKLKLNVNLIQQFFLVLNRYLREYFQFTQNVDYDADDAVALLDLNRCFKSLFQHYDVVLFVESCTEIVFAYLNDADTSNMLFAICFFTDLFEFTDSVNLFHNISEKCLSLLQHPDGGIRQGIAYLLGMACVRYKSQVSDFLRRCVPVLCSILQDPCSRESESIFATENSLSTLIKICLYSPSSIDKMDFMLHIIVQSQPCVNDVAEAPICTNFLLDLIDSMHPSVSCRLPEVAYALIQILKEQCVELVIINRTAEAFKKILSLLSNEIKSNLWNSLDKQTQEILSLKGYV